jgi:DNA-binding NtrC family response regulator
MGQWEAPELRATQLAPRKRSFLLPPVLTLTVLSGPDRGRTVTLGRGVYRVGTLDDCDLVLADRQVSRCHLELRVGDDGVALVDLGSRNGSFHEGARFSQIVVGVGAVVALGKSELRLGSAGASGPALLPSVRTSVGELVGDSLLMREVYGLIERAARSDVAVLVEGETGTGKELVATAIHAMSRRHPGPFVVCDLSAIAPTLIESELFGHTRNAFTGSERARPGVFEDAQRGTIFLDEIGELDKTLQPRLLRAVETGRVKPLGAVRYRKVDVRVIAASNRTLGDEVKAGRFRQDLYYRVSVLRIALPPLRQRRQDIPALVRHFLGGRALEVPVATMARLCAYDWPGNVRELKNAVERAAALAADDGQLTTARFAVDGEATAPRPLERGGFRAAKRSLVADWERQAVAELLARSGGNVAEAARLGGVDRVSFHRLVRKYKLGRRR